MSTATTPSDLHRIARWFHALSDETRLGIVRKLAAGERCVCDLTNALDAAQSRLSFHLKVLRTAGLVNARRQGRWVYYSLRPAVLETMSAFLLDARPQGEEWYLPDGSCCGNEC